jgi:hypothetical protein
MRSLILVLAVVGSLFPSSVRGDTHTAGFHIELEQVYAAWRNAVTTRNFAQWERATARDRRIAVRNRIHSERRPFPGAVFDLPFPPPKLQGLKRLRVESSGSVAKAVYFGKVDFGVDGKPTDNLLVVNYVNEGGWRYDGAEYVNLSALPDVRKQLLAGNLAYVKTPDFAPQPKPRVMQPELKGPVKYIAKSYIYAPGRDVEIYVNRLSRHRVRNSKESEVIIGGARDGRNEIQYNIQSLPGSTGKEPVAIRVYLMSQVQGVKPVMVYEMLVPENGVITQPTGTKQFMVTPEVVRKLQGR